MLWWWVDDGLTYFFTLMEIHMLSIIFEYSLTSSFVTSMIAGLYTVPDKSITSGNKNSEPVSYNTIFQDDTH